MKRKLRKNCLQVLQHTFGLTAFRPGQEAAVSALLSGRDLLCVLPTGSGKSLCWQLPAVLNASLTIVISPLIALMQDQVMQLQGREIAAAMLSSLMQEEERLQVCERVKSGEIRILFVSPERLESPSFLQLCKACPPWLMVVDEAHCIVQWGEEFRPPYSRIAEFASCFAKRPVLCALTATADRAMQRDIIENLRMVHVKRVNLPVIRQNIHYHVTTALYKSPEILRILSMQQGKTVIFCRTRERTVKLAETLMQKGYRAMHYHAGMTREERVDVQEQFSSGGIQVLTATTAFGMGVDISDIRCIIHDYLPDNVTDYVQQSGRAGRDGLTAESWLILTPYDFLSTSRHYAHMRKQMKRHPVSVFSAMRQDWRAKRQLLQVALSAPCIPAALAGCFGHHVKPCGICSSCRMGAMQESVPDFRYMPEWEMRLWLLKWQRGRIAKHRQCKPHEVLTDSTARDLARWMQYPEDGRALPEGITRMVRCFRQMSGME